MALKKGLKDLLLADSTISSMVGSRVRVGRKPKDTDHPDILITGVASAYIPTLQGVNATKMRRFQIDCWGNNPKEADDLATAVHALLDGYRGVLSEGTRVHSCLPNSDVDLDDEDGKISGVAVDFNVWFTPRIS
jgi:Protein of unknown function (DUF3168)